MNRFYESGTEADLHFGSELAKRTPSSELRASSGAELRPADSFAIEPVATRYRRTTAERLFVRRRRRGAVSGLTRTCRPPQGDGGERHALARDHAVQPAAERGNPPRAGACEGLAMSLARIAGLRAAKLRPAALTCDFCATRSRAEGPATSGREKQPSARGAAYLHALKRELVRVEACGAHARLPKLRASASGRLRPAAHPCDSHPREAAARRRLRHRTLVVYDSSPRHPDQTATTRRAP